VQGEFRQLWVSTLLPTASLALQRHVAQRQHYSLDGEMAVRHFRAVYAIDVRQLARAVSCPTLVTHFDGDANVPLGLGTELAALIPGARFVSLRGDAHAPFEGGDAWQGFIDVVGAFLD
jgi:pimeloyl-ACP methyl ester carboxylesterase